MFEDFFSDNYMIGIITLILVLYSGLARPKLPGFIRKLFESPVFRIFILSLIVYRGNKNPQLSIAIAFVFTMSMDLIKEQELKEKFEY